MKNIASILFCALLMASCAGTQFYQVYKTESATVKPTGENSALRFEDSRCRIDYNLWAENGDAGFTFYNKTDEVIHLHLDNSFYVLNGIAYDYFQNRIFTNGSESVSKSGHISTSKLGLLTLYSNTTSSASATSNSVSVNEAKIILIPSKTAKRISEFDINQVLFRDCELLRFPSPNDVATKSFTPSSTPLNFYNSIVFTVGENTVKHNVKNDFYVSQITNLGEKQMVKNVRDEFCDQKGRNIMQLFREKSADRFYIKYMKVNTDTRKY